MLVFILLPLFMAGNMAEVNFFRWLNCRIKRLHGQVLSEVYGEALSNTKVTILLLQNSMPRSTYTLSFSVVTSVELKFGWWQDA